MITDEMIKNMKYKVVKHKYVLDRSERKQIIKKLTEEAEKFLKENYGMKLSIPITLNGRLRRMAGRFCYQGGLIGGKALRIEISVASAVTLSEEHLTSLLQHELIHYALFKRRLPFMDSDKSFQDELTLMKVQETIPAPVFYTYLCRAGHKIPSSQKFNKVHYCKCGHEIII